MNICYHIIEHRSQRTSNKTRFGEFDCDCADIVDNPKISIRRREFDVFKMAFEGKNPQPINSRLSSFDSTRESSLETAKKKFKKQQLINCLLCMLVLANDAVLSQFRVHLCLMPFG